MSRIQYNNPPITEAVAGKSIDNLLASVDYSDDQKEQIIEFLQANEAIINVLEGGMTVLKQRFSQRSLKLVFFEDPEEGRDKLILIVKANLDLDEALDLEDKIFDEWYVNLETSMSMMLNYLVV